MADLPQEALCPCGRPRRAAEVHVYRSHADEHRFYRCECGNEWTASEHVVDLTEPVSSDEVLDVRDRLSRLDGPLSDLLG